MATPPTFSAIVLIVLLPLTSAEISCVNTINKSFANPGNYYPQQMTVMACRLACNQKKSYQNAALIQGRICLCQPPSQSGLASSSCNNCTTNATVCGNGNGTGLYAVPCNPSFVKYYKVGADAVLSNTPFGSTLQTQCLSGSPESVAVQTRYYYPNFTDYAYQTAYLGSTQNLTATYAYFIPGYIVVKTTVTTRVSNIQVSNLSVKLVQRAVGPISPIPITFVLANNTYTIQVSICCLSSASITVSAVPNLTTTSNLLDSTDQVWSTLGLLVKSNISTNTVTILPVRVTYSQTILDMRLQLAGNYSAETSSVLYLQIYHPQCDSGAYYCFLANACINSNLSCTIRNETFRKSFCNLTSNDTYSLASRGCVKTKVKLLKPEFGVYSLLYEIPINFSNATQLTTNNSEVFVNLASQLIKLQPGDLLAIYQSNTTNFAVATGQGNATTVPVNSINGWSQRNASSPAVVFYTDVTTVATTVPLVSFTFTRVVNAGVTLMYRNHSCDASPVGCHKEDLYNVSIVVNNTVSASYAFKTVHVLLPIGNVSVFQSELSTTFVPVNLTINQHVGSTPQYVINFGDYQVINSSYNSGLNVYQHVYVKAGSFVTSVFVYNALSSQMVTKNVKVCDSIQGLRLVPKAYPAGPLGRELTFVLYVTQATNASYSVTFGHPTKTLNFTADYSYTATAPNYEDYFTVVPGTSVRRAARHFFQTGAAPLEQCAKACLQSTAANFYCQLFSLDSIQGTCSLYDGNIDMTPSFSLAWHANANANANASVYALQNLSCAPDLLQFVPLSTTATTIPEYLRSADFLPYTFLSLVQINVLRLNESITPIVKLFYTTDTLSWTQYTGFNTSNSTFDFSPNVSYIVFDPPIVARGFGVLIMGITPWQSSAIFSLSGCLLPSASQTLNATFTHDRFNKTTVVNITVVAFNAVSNASLSLAYFLDKPMQTLSVRSLSGNPVMNVNMSTRIRVTGDWSKYVEIVIMRNDSLVMSNMTYTDAQPFYDYTLYFTSPGRWFLTAVASNYVGTVTNAMAQPILVLGTGNGCKVPDVDISGPNACVPNVSCDSQYPGLYALKVLRGKSFTIRSSTTNFCSKPALFSWSVQNCDASALCSDYSANISRVYAQRYSKLRPFAFSGSQLRQLTFEPRVFAFGLYRVSLLVTIVNATVSNESQVEPVASSDLFISVQQTPLQACVNNNTFAISSAWDWSVNLTLDAACSSDPDLWPDEPNGLTFFWSCYRACETPPIFDARGDFVAWTNVQYNSLCRSDSDSQMGCFRPFGIHQSGPLTPHTMDDWSAANVNNSLIGPRNAFANNSVNANFSVYGLWPYVTASDNSSVTLRTIAMFYKQEHFFILSIGKQSDSRQEQALVIVYINTVLGPALKTICKANCYQPDNASPTSVQFIVDPNASFKLAVSVMNFNPLAQYSYNWSVCKTSGNRSKKLGYDELTAILSNPSNYSVGFDWSHASTGMNSIGVSFDSGLPAFNASLQECTLALVSSVTMIDSAGSRTSWTYFLFLATNPPEIGSVLIKADPPTGSAFTTYFSISCSSGNSSNPPISYSIGYATYLDKNADDQTSYYLAACNWVAVKQRDCSTPNAVLLPAGNASRNYTLEICVALTDDVGSSNYLSAPAVQVLPANLTAAQIESVATLSSLQTIVLNNPHLYPAYATALLGTINPPTYDSNTSCVATNPCVTAAPDSTPATVTRAQQNIVYNVLNAMLLLPIATSVENILQYAGLAQRATENAAYLVMNSTTMALLVLDQLSDNLLAVTQSATGCLNQLDAAASQLTASVADVLLASTERVKETSRSALSSSLAATMTQSLINQSNLISSSFKVIASAALLTKVPGEKMTIYNKILGTQILTPNDLQYRSFTVNESYCTQFTIGATDGLFSASRNSTPAIVQLITSQTQKNQFMWLPNAANMAMTQSMSLAQSGEEYNISDATGPRTFEIWLDTQLDPSTVAPLNANTTPYTLLPSNKMLTHKVVAKSQSNVFINVQQYLNWSTVAVNETFNGSVPQYYSVLQNKASYNDTNVMFLLYIQKDTLPTDTDYLANCTLPNFDIEYLSCASQTLNASALDRSSLNATYTLLANQTKSSFYDSLAKAQTSNRCMRFARTQMNPWTCMFTPEQLNNTNDSTYFVGVRAIQWNWTALFNETNKTKLVSSAMLPANKDKWVYLELNYTFFAYCAGCYFFDANIQDFSTAGCTVGKCSSPYAVQCFCTHLTSFSSFFRLPRISFDIASLNLEALNKSPGVMCFLVSVLCAYAILWIWARYADQKSEEALGVVYLPENDARDSYAYEVTVWTGSMPGCGTTSNVSIVLAGDNAESEARWLRDPTNEKKTFQAGSADVFLVTTQNWLGPLSHVRVWHDCTGSRPSWYLLRVLVRDIYTNSKSYFIINNWLSAEKSSGEVERLVPVAGKQDLRDVKNVLWTRGSSKLLGGHMWLSVATRPARSRFTRVQRLTCCLVMCLDAVLFNLLGYIVRLSANQQAREASANPDTPIFVMGPIQLTVYSVSISLISAVCTIPVNLLLVLLFNERGIRRSERKSTDPYDRFHSASKEHREVNVGMPQDEADSSEDSGESWCEKVRDCLSDSVAACLSKVFPLPWWSHYVAYVLAFLATVTAFLCTAILAYSNLPQAWQQEDWLSSIVLSLLLSIFVVHPAQLLLIVFTFALILRLPEEDQDEMSAEIAVSRPLISIPTESDEQPRSQPVAKPPPSSALTQSMVEHHRKEQDVRSTIVSCISFVVLLGILFAVLSLLATPLRYQQTSQMMQNLQLHHPHNMKKSLPNVVELWTYLAVKALPALFTNTMRRNLTRKSPSTQKYSSNSTATASIASVLLGARLRQLRVPSNSCSVPDMIASVVTTCNGEYILFNSDKANYATFWRPVASLQKTNTSSPFHYDISAAGYVSDLGESLAESLTLITTLSAFGWIDARSRVLILEFLAYNPNTALYTVGHSRFLLNPAGIIYEPNLYSLRLNHYAGVGGTVFIMCELLVLLGLTVFVLKTLCSLCHKPKLFCRDKWEMFDLATSIVIIATAAVHGVQVSASLYAESVIRQSPISFTNLMVLCMFDRALSSLLGLLAFLLSLRMVRFLRIQKRLNLMLAVLANAFSSFLGMLFQLLVTVMAMVAAFYLVYSSNAQEYSTTVRSLASLGVTFASTFNFEPIIENRNVVGAVLFSIYVALVHFILMRVFIPALVLSRRVARQRQDALDDEQEKFLTSFLWKCRMFWGCPKSAAAEETYHYQTEDADCDETWQDFERQVHAFSQSVRNNVGSTEFNKYEELKNDFTDEIGVRRRDKKKDKHIRIA